MSISYRYKINFSFIITLISTFNFICYSQDQDLSKNDLTLIETYENYTTPARELIYTHLNKSTFIKGESVGFTAYIFDKESKKTSLATTNVYFSIFDKNKNEIKSKLVKAKNGVASSIFYIDSLFTSGEYTFKTFTNWQRNFNEPNSFEQIIKVIDPEVETFIDDTAIETKIDAQFLPESGHAVYNVKNTFGVILKDKNGYGIPNLEGKITDFENNVISSFKANNLGISKFTFKPEKNKKYKAIINYNNEEFEYEIKNIEAKGIVFSINNVGEKLFVSLKTNAQTLENIKNSNYSLFIHNGNDIKRINVLFKDKLEITKLINTNNLNRGINIFTLFNSENKPLLERLFFKYDDTLSSIKNDNYTVSKDLDSVSVKLDFKNINPEEFNNISISVLPTNTKSYNHNHNILSYTFLQPYVKGNIENAKYYFSNINNKKKYDLDNLLITQGWSSYNWHDIFNNPPKSTYPFETGISFRATVNNRKSNQFLVYPLKNSKADIFQLKDNENIFQKFNIQPESNEYLKIAEIKSNNKFGAPKLFLQFYPNHVPNLDYPFKHLKSKSKSYIKNLSIQPFVDSNLNTTQELEEVYIEAKKTYTRTQELQKKSFGRVFVLDEKTRRHSPRLAVFLASKGVKASDTFGEFTINGQSQAGSGTPTVFLDGFELTNFGFLSSYNMDVIDYIEIKRASIGQGIRGGTGRVIKIYTDPFRLLNTDLGSIPTFKAYEFPLAYDSAKKFYIPKYQYYKTSFFKEYGVINWYPNKKIDTNKQINITFYYSKSESVNLYIEGIANNGKFISEIKNIIID